MITDPRTLARIKSLVIPPAWKDVWICADPQGHIQAVGTDAAGRRQYRYHDQWREQQDRDKHDRVREFGGALPHIREVVGHHLEGRGLTRERAGYPARAGGPWLCRTLVRSGFQAVVVPSGFRTRVQPHRWITIS